MTEDRPETLSEDLLYIADLLDLADQWCFYETIAAARGIEWDSGDDIQKDLRRLARYLQEVAPMLDRRLATTIAMIEARES